MRVWLITLESLSHTSQLWSITQQFNSFSHSPTDLWGLAEVGLQGMNCIVELLYCLLAENHLHRILEKS